ncbi:MAG: DUF3048 domain-containing protein [Clostridia bacterium]|nr:DUF3048 domain-containing protein [Clostridia bacterium]
MRETRTKKRKSKRGTSLLIVILLLLIIVAGVLFIMKVSKESKKTGETSNSNTSIAGEEKPKEELKPKTFAGDERPIAFMLDNNINAMPQAGLIQADLVYEIIVEGGETRLMAVMKNKNLDKIGPLRSARHYFLDYALENDAIYVHYGQSPQAKDDIKSLAISDINGINESESSFWRDSSRYAPHNAVTSTQKIKKIIERENFRTTTNKGNVLNYVVEEVELEEKKEEPKEGEMEGKVTNLAKTVTIPYSSYNTVKYTYDEQTKTYIRYSRNKKQIDWNTNETVTAKNIIITKCKNTTLNDGTTKGRQTLDNVKTLDGYYITNGKYISIKCEKTARSEKTIYKDLQGNEIKVNDGKTFIQICPIDSKISFE